MTTVPHEVPATGAGTGPRLGLRARHGLATVLALFAAALPIAGQEQAPEQPLPDLFSDVIDVRVINVEVVVTDRTGARVPNLQASDFELLVDGEPVLVDYFTEVADGRSQPSSDQDDASAPQVPSLVPGEPVGTNYLIFVDDLFAIRQHRNRVLNRLASDLARIAPDDRMALVAWDGSDLSLITDWTASPGAMEGAFRQATRREARGHLYAFGMGDPAEKTRRSVMAAAGALRSFAEAPGRKVMMLLVEGWATALDSWNAGSAFSAASAGATLDRLYGPLVNAANRVGYSLYPVDLPGLQGKPIDIEQRDPLATWSSSSERRFHDVLQFLADETGGLPMVNSFSRKALARTVADTRSYYWLGFAPRRDGGDRQHDIRVRVVGADDLRVRSREKYLDMSRGAEISMMVEGALLLGGSPGAEVLEVTFGAPSKAGLLKRIVPMTVAIPLDDVDLLEIDGLWRNELDLRLRLLDQFGNIVAPPKTTLPIALHAKPGAGDVFIFESRLLLRNRRYRYMAAVHDPLAATLLSAGGTLPRVRASAPQAATAPAH